MPNPGVKSWTDVHGTLHEIYTGTLYADGQYLGAFEYDSGREDLRWNRFSTAFFCRHCGEIWGRLIAQDSRGAFQTFTILDVACKKHHDHWNVPGSMLVGNIENLLSDFPKEALIREFALLDKDND